MRVTIKFDSATTEAVREMAVALNHVGLEGQLRVGLNGPECWHGETPPLSSHQWARVAAMLVKVDGSESLAAFVDRHR
jgi:hypothetical protein